jgi:CheY-like chemotaxis protein
MTRVLVVEDEIVVLVLADSVIGELGHSTVSAGSMTEALHLLESEDEFDLLFTDIRLPESEFGGFELAKAARDKYSNLKVLYTTGDTVTDGMKAMFVENSLMLPKPYTAPMLSEALVKLLGESGVEKTGNQDTSTSST